ncbi:hypothetical protein BLOT_016487 [Blomia tropicalis]|nr:hypothetical protein BLOT_016487 [Blomia tropicalis]
MERNNLNATDTNDLVIFPLFSGKIIVDSELTYSKLEIDEKDNVKHYIKNILKERPIFNPLNKSSSFLHPYHACLFASKVDFDYDEMIKAKYVGLPEGWKLLTTASNFSVFNGYFGAVFWHPINEQVIIVHQGSEQETPKLHWANFLSLYGKKVFNQIDSAVTFSHHVQRIFAEIDQEYGTHFQMFITSHSIGGWLAQVTTFSVKYLTISDKEKIFCKSMKEGYHAHTIVFDSPGCKPMLLQMQDYFDVRYSNGEKLPIYLLDITNYLSAPNLINTCNTHVGKIYRVIIDFSTNNSSYNLIPHDLNNFLETFDKKTGLFKKDKFGNYNLQEIVEWPHYSRYIKKKDYDHFFKWFEELNNCYLTDERIHFKKYPISYQSKQFNEKQCSFNIFTQSEQLTLKQYKLLQEFPNLINLHTLFTNENLKILNNLSIDQSNNIVTINNGSIVELYSTISYIKNLLINYPEKTKKINNWLSIEGILEKLLKSVSTNYLQSNKKWLKFKTCKHIDNMLLKFLNNPNQIVWRVNVSTGDTFCTLKQIYNSFLKTFEHETIDSYTNENCLILDLYNLLFVDRLLKMQTFFETTKNDKKLFIVDYNINKINNDSGSIKIFLSNLFEKLKISQSYKIILIAKQDSVLESILYKSLNKKQYMETKDEGFTWNDLDVSSQNELLNNREINFHDKEKKLFDLFNEFNINKVDIDKLIDFNSLIYLINNENKIIVVGKIIGIDELEGAYADMFEEVNKNTFELNLCDDLKEAVYFISGLFTDDDNNFEKFRNKLNFKSDNIHYKLNYLKSPYQLQSDNKNIYLVDSQFMEKDFNKLCKKHFNKKIMYWIKWNGAKFYLQRLYNPGFYVKRKFYNVLMKNDKKMFKNEDSFVFNGLECEKNFENLFKDSSLIINPKIHIKPTADDAKITFNEINGNVHWMEIKSIESNIQIVWRDSKGSIQNIRQYIDNINFLIENENSLIDFIKDKQTIIFSGDPGMGKSTTLVKLYQSILSDENTKLVESNWIIHVNLKYHLETVKSCFPDIKTDIDIDNIVEFLSKIVPKLSNNISKILLKCTLLGKNCNHKPLLISFDNFDELYDFEDKTKIVDFLEYLINNTKTKIWITTRSHYCEVLENTLSTFAIKFHPMDIQSIKLFIHKFLKHRLSLILKNKTYSEFFETDKKNKKKLLVDIFCDKVFEKTNSLFKREITELIKTPLQLYLLLDTKVFSNEFKQWINNTDKPFNFNYVEKDIVSVYEDFINNKYEILFKKNGKLPNIIKVEIKKYLNSLCASLAGNSVFSFEYDHRISNETVDLLSSFGIIKFKKNGLKFIHQTFEEYYLSEKWMIVIKLSDLIYKSFGTMINNELNKKHSNLIMNEIGNTIIDIAAEEGNLNIVDFILNSLKMVKSVLVKQLVCNKKNNLKETALHITVRNGYVEILNRLMTLFDNGSLIKVVNDNDENGNSVLHLAVKNNNVDIVENLIARFDKDDLFEILSYKDENGDSVLHVAAKDNNVEIVEKLLIPFYEDKKTLIKVINDKDSNGYSTLHIAVKNCNVEIVKRLMALFDDADSDDLIEVINDKGEQEESSLHMAIEKNSFEIFDKLISLFDNKKDVLIKLIKNKDSSENSSLHSAVKNKNVEIVERIIAVFGNDKKSLIECIKDKGWLGNSVLHIAIENDNVEIVEKLIIWFDEDENALIELVSDENWFGKSVLYKALENDNIELVKKLFKLFDNKKDVLIKKTIKVLENENSFFHKAIKNGQIEIVIKSKDKLGYSSLHIAVENGFVGIVRILTTLFNDKNDLIEFVHDKNVYGNSILHIAAENDFVEIVKFLITLFDGNEEDWNKLILNPLFNDNKETGIKLVNDKNKEGNSALKENAETDESLHGHNSLTLLRRR